MAVRSAVSLIFHIGILSLLTLLRLGRSGALAQRTGRIRDLTAAFEIVEESPGQSYVGNVAVGAGLDKIYNASVHSTLEFGFIPQPGHDTEFFRIEPDTGILRTSRPIDRDVKCPGKPDCHIQIAVAILKPVEFFQLIAVTISLVDINDNVPVFNPSEYGIRFSESDPVGTSRSLPIALDKDSPRYGVQDYTMVTKVSEFRLEKNTNPGSRLTDLKLVLVEPLDREVVDTYMVIIEAVDGGTPPKTGSLLIDIAVEDDNDHTPQFQNDSYVISVREDFPVNMTFFTLHAVDPDAGDNGKVAYTFDPLTASLYGAQFKIERYTGAISLKKGLDYESVNTFQLQVAASDMAPNSRSTLAHLELHVIDVNDNYPEITISTLTDSEVAEVRENLPTQQFVGYVSVFDSDVGENGEVLCGLSHQSFDMVSISQNQYKIITTESLDREAVGSYILKVVCYDMGDPSLSTSRDLTVHVADDNDHSPVFYPSQYSESIRENNMVDAYILRLNATDMDSGQNAQLEYHIVEPIVSKYVYVQRKSGVIRAAQVLDFEQIQIIEFTVSVTDQGDPPRSASAFVTINILDTNDEAPRFNYPHYSFSIMENQQANIIVGQVTAFDLDSAPYNVLEYSLSPRYHDDQGSFDIDTITGEIIAMAPLDREERSIYYMTAFASDVDNPSLISSASVTVYVNDENDNFPMITFPQENNRTFEISTKVPLGYNVTRVVVEDEDIGDNARISYSILSGDDGGIFAVDQDVGVISVTQDLSPIEYAEFWLRIIVQDHGTPVKADTVDVLLIVDNSLPYYPPDGRGQGMVRKSNLTIIIVVSAVSGFIIVILIIAIALLKMLDRRRFHGKEYNCRNEEQKILNDLNIKAVEANGNLHLQERGVFGAGKDMSRMGQGRSKNSLDRNKQRGDYPGTSLEMEERSSSHMTTTQISNAADAPQSPRSEYHQNEKHLEAHLMALLKQDQDADSASSADMSNTDSGRGASEEGEARYNTIAHPGEYGSHQGSNVSLCGTQHGYIHPRHLRPPPRPQPRLVGQGHPYAHGHTISGSPGRPVVPAAPTTNLQHRKAASDIDVQRPCLARKILCSGDTSASLQSLPSASSHYQSPGGAKHVTFTGSGPVSPTNSDERCYAGNQGMAPSVTAQQYKDNGKGQGNYGNAKGSQTDDVWQRRRRQERALRDIREEEDNNTRNDEGRVDSEQICQQIDEIFFKQKSVMV